MTDAPAVLLRDVCKRFSNRRNTFVALEGLSLTVNSGNVMGLFGFSGCGKTTILRIICGVLDFDSGKVEVLGLPAPNQRGKVAYVPQRFGLLPWRTLWGNALLGGSIMAKDSNAIQTDIEERARKLFAEFELSDQMKKYPTACSVGQQQRAAIIRALLTPSEVLAFDEPAAALDHFSRQTLYKTLETVALHKTGQSKGRTVLLVSHDPEDLLMICDQIAVLSKTTHNVVQTIDIDFARPREKELRFDPAFIEKKRLLCEVLK